LHAQLLKHRVIMEIPVYDKLKVIKLYRNLIGLFPQFGRIDGYHNMWIVKPSYNARGIGIYCSRDINEIVPDRRQQQKVV
jgi:hypothetical protein